LHLSKLFFILNAIDCRVSQNPFGSRRRRTEEIVRRDPSGTCPARTMTKPIRFGYHLKAGFASFQTRL